MAVQAASFSVKSVIRQVDATGFEVSSGFLSVMGRCVACGDPPIINGDDPSVYFGYFENAFGEQWVFSFDRATKNAELRGGDIGWNTVHEVRDGEVGALVLGPAEAAWLQACWKSATGR